MAPHVFHVLLTALLCFLQTGDCGNIAGLTTIITTPNPPRVTLTPNVSHSIIIACIASSVDTNQEVFAINIQRVLHANPNADPVVLAAALSTRHQGNAELQASAPQGSNVTGSLGEKTVTLTLNRANCCDSGKYICTASSLDNATKTRYYASDTNISIQVNPGPITIKPLITSETGCCSVGQTLRMTCGQFVGIDDNSSQHNWVWEFKDKNAADWQSYAVIGNPTADITQRQPPSTDPCYKHYSSSLSRRLTLEDSERQYRCYVNGRVTGQGVDKAKVHPVGTLQARGDEENGKSETGDKDNKEKTETEVKANKENASQASATNWLAIGLGVAGAVACLGVGLGVALHCRRKASGQQSSPGTAMNTGDTALVGQSGQEPYDAIDDNVSEASTASDADTASDASSDVD
ncbi:uncharacterized protein [Littorina saxatilis]|uniref:Ig-like domain-containing protein n=1 Tax=Littorina saxatilis TaxID=31220 RepID=A0AAN9BNG4_9CAEN